MNYRRYLPRTAETALLVEGLVEPCLEFLSVPLGEESGRSSESSGPWVDDTARSEPLEGLEVGDKSLGFASGVGDDRWILPSPRHWQPGASAFRLASNRVEQLPTMLTLTLRCDEGLDCRVEVAPSTAESRHFSEAELFEVEQELSQALIVPREDHLSDFRVRKDQRNGILVPVAFVGAVPGKVWVVTASGRVVPG